MVKPRFLSGDLTGRALSLKISSQRGCKQGQIERTAGRFRKAPQTEGIIARGLRRFKDRY